MDWKTGRPLKEVIAENNAKAQGQSVGASPFDNPGAGAGAGASPFDNPAARASPFNNPGAGASPFDNPGAITGTFNNAPLKTTNDTSPFDAPDQIGKPPS